MAYEPTVWECGDTITAEKLNKLEEAVANSGGSEPLVVGMTVKEDIPSAGQTTYTLDKTWQEINGAFPNVYIQDVDGKVTTKYSIDAIAFNESIPNYTVKSNIGVMTIFGSTSADGYPTYVDGSI